MSPKDFGRRLSLDTRMISQILEKGDQPSTWLSEWGGPSGYQFWAKQPLADRLTFFAVTEGFNTPQDIASAADLKVSDVRRSLSKLEKAGLIETGVTTK